MKNTLKALILGMGWLGFASPARISDHTAFFMMGELVEYDVT